VSADGAILAVAGDNAKTDVAIVERDGTLRATRSQPSFSIARRMK
jgi:hypothetical protein